MGHLLADSQGEVDHYEKAREEVKLASGDYVDMKMFEPAMRHLLDTYIRAEESEKLLAFDDMTLVQLIVDRGAKAVDALPDGIRRNEGAVAETIENNVRRLIIDEMAVNPRYYERMSELLDALIAERKRKAMDYKTYLAQLVALTKQVSNPATQTPYPLPINDAPLRALFDNLQDVPDLEERLERTRAVAEVRIGATAAELAALALDKAIRGVKKADWRGNRFKEREVRNAVQSVLGEDGALVDTVFEIVRNQRAY